MTLMESNLARIVAPHHGVPPCFAVVGSTLGSLFRNNWKCFPLVAHTTCPHRSPGGSLITWGVSPTDVPLPGYSLPPYNAVRGASPLAPTSALCDAHKTLLRVCPLRQGSPTRWSAAHPAAPLRGFTLGLRSPPPGHPCLVRAYGSFRVYDPRHYRVPSTLGAPWRSLPTSLNTASIPTWTVAPHHGVYRGFAVGYSAVVGRTFGNNYHHHPFLAHPTPLYSTHIWGVRLTDFPLSGFLLPRHNAVLGACTLAPTLTSSDAHKTPARVPWTSRQGSSMRWIVCLPTAPLRGFSGFRSQPPGRSGLVRAYGSARVYDPRHNCVPSTFGAPGRFPPPTSWFKAARPLPTMTHWACSPRVPLDTLLTLPWVLRSAGRVSVQGRRFPHSAAPPRVRCFGRGPPSWRSALRSGALFRGHLSGLRSHLPVLGPLLPLCSPETMVVPMPVRPCIPSGAILGCRRHLDPQGPSCFQCGIMVRTDPWTWNAHGECSSHIPSLPRRPLSPASHVNTPLSHISVPPRHGPPGGISSIAPPPSASYTGGPPPSAATQRLSAPFSSQSPLSGASPWVPPPCPVSPHDSLQPPRSSTGRLGGRASHDRGRHPRPAHDGE